ncbi:uncharacterized protein GLRG_10270 [Colletotrichum graminicola M1.001]|uniref:Uncharacterized protein n=1 Tax=Colletotrichum graminicola (strain M1.001 / M2 / FGSC 10212) TaxID=645133 RepID=E3QW92_COLGM|nr:uncharacterized protein GLRG_10270 [Colletotrichum graminicola M1.001]EFQ35126.1 hypothetical protein GLRG_10270 [Colletotrichum graminicola M1.001]
MGAPINLYGVHGKNALQEASSRGALLVVQFLLDQGADANAPAHDDGGRTALQTAVESGHDDIAKCLLDAKADVRAPPAKQRGMTVLEAFTYSSSYLSTKGFRDWLSRGAPINRPGGDYGNVLHLLVRQLSKPASKCLDLALQAEARIEDKDQFDCGQKTPLQVAAEVGNLDYARLLLKYGAQVNAAPGDEFGRTALQAAACGMRPADTPAMVELLLSVGADVHAPPAKKGGITALQGAAISGDISIAQQLIDHGADVNAAPAVEEGRTAHGRLDMVRFLISVGAVPDTEKGFSRAIELAENENHLTIADFSREQQELFAGFSTGMGDMFSGDLFSQGPKQGFVSDENLGDFAFPMKRV